MLLDSEPKVCLAKVNVLDLSFCAWRSKLKTVSAPNYGEIVDFWN